jgi:ABC-type nitrate/sulfonate/bicarbonate transport system ATPase subunit/flavin-dependent dehydrogenase
MSNAETKTDVAIIGGGPAGAATALFLLKAGLKPAIIEKETFPRYHIGESLTGECGECLRNLGLEERMNAEGNPIKHGVKVWGPGGKNSFWVEVKERMADRTLRPSTTWQVRRSRFDQILLETAIARGADYFPGEAIAPLLDGDRVTGLRFRNAQGVTRDLNSDVLVDASGLATFLANKGLTTSKQRGEFDKQVAIFSQLSALVRDAGDDAEQKPGNTLVFHGDKYHWAWFIPLDKDTTSVGVVTPSDYFSQHKLSKADFLRQELKNLNPELARRVTNFNFVEDTRAASSHSYWCRHFTGKGFLCVGDSHRFMDPIFSFGLSFAVKEAQFASEAIIRYINGETRDLPNPFAEYESLVDNGQDVIQDLVDCFWEYPLAFQMLVHHSHQEDMIDLFAGRVYRDDVKDNGGLASMRQLLSTRETKVAEVAAKPVAPTKLKVEGLNMIFRRDGKAVNVLENVRLEAREGEFLCILGPSGCGKSTLLNIVAGFLKPTTGRVSIDDEDVRGPDPRRVFVFQERGVFPWLTVEGNIGFGLNALPEGERKRRIAHYVKLVGLEGFEQAYPQELSGGMKQRVEVARALAVNPDMLFLDEPFGALDSITRLVMRSELLRIWEAERKTILFVTHDIEESVQLADRVIVMSARPAEIRRIVEIDIPHPRDISSRRYLELRDGIFEEIGLAHKV